MLDNSKVRYINYIPNLNIRNGKKIKKLDQFL